MLRLLCTSTAVQGSWGFPTTEQGVGFGVDVATALGRLILTSEDDKCDTQESDGDQWASGDESEQNETSDKKEPNVREAHPDSREADRKSKYHWQKMGTNKKMR